MSSSYKCIEATNLDEVREHLPAWHDLLSRTLEDNYYLTPSFIMAAMRHYGDQQHFRIVFVYGDAQLVAVAPFSLHQLPLGRSVPTLRGIVSPHGYLSHPLVAHDHVAQAVSALLDWTERPSNQWQLIVIPTLSATSPLAAALLRELETRKRVYDVRQEFRRATLIRRENFDEYLRILPRSRRKSYRRHWAKLEQVGKVDVVLHREVADPDRLAHRFMDIEHRSWKGANDTALASADTDSAFFVDIVREAARAGTLYFVELRVNDQPVAMTANFVCGRTLFAFKIAYDPVYAKHSPGTLAELATIKLFHETPELTVGDGGAYEQSYVSAYWRDLVPMHQIWIAMPRRSAEVYLILRGIIARLKRLAVGFVRRIEHVLFAGVSIEPSMYQELMNCIWRCV